MISYYQATYETNVTLLVYSLFFLSHSRAIGQYLQPNLYYALSLIVSNSVYLVLYSFRIPILRLS